MNERLFLSASQRVFAFLFMLTAKPELSKGRLVAKRTPRFAALRITVVLKKLAAFGCDGVLALISAHFISVPLLSR
ncbi:hypothetical protein, partial [Ochrobactrum sp. C6C9]|uniref:hypothetical protein n=1 Tax=Ochrobactrum sp. C6C9 TaxID=2736662 RepID=UPI00353015DB